MPIDLPASPGFMESKFGLETNTGRFESPLTKATQRILLSGSRWTFSATLPQMNRSQAATWQAFLLKLEGGVNTFNGYDPDAREPRGPMGGTPLVKGASQTGSTLAIDGCTANITGWGKAGDYFSVNGELKMLTADCNTNGSGEATLSFKPALRNSPADNAALTARNATCTMILTDDMQAVWQANANHIYQPITITAFEVFS